MIVYAYDIRSQFVEPVLVVYDLETFEKIVSATYGTKPDWMYVSTQRMHPYEPDRYKSNVGASGHRAKSVSRANVKNNRLQDEILRLKKLLSAAENRAMAAEALAATSQGKLDDWKSSNMRALRDLAVEILTTK